MLDNPERIFSRHFQSICAAGDIFVGDKFNPTVFAAHPSLDTYTKLVSSSLGTASSLSEHLNAYFSGWFLGDASGHLPLRFNIPTSLAILRPAVWDQLIATAVVVTFDDLSFSW